MWPDGCDVIIYLSGNICSVKTARPQPKSQDCRVGIFPAKRPSVGQAGCRSARQLVILAPTRRCIGFRSVTRDILNMSTSVCNMMWEAGGLTMSEPVRL